MFLERFGIFVDLGVLRREQVDGSVILYFEAYFLLR